jgi:hypothetical protein
MWIKQPGFSSAKGQRHGWANPKTIALILNQRASPYRQELHGIFPEATLATALDYGRINHNKSGV